MARKKKKDEDLETEVVERTPGGEDVGKLVKSFIKAFNKDGEEKVAWNLGSDDDNPTDVKEFISTGSTLLDYIISNRRDGGVPTGKLTEISGEEASGKSLVCAHLIANVQKKGGLAVYIDSENAANPDFMQQVGVDINKLVYLQPGTIESVFEHIEQCIEMARAKDIKKPVLIIWDSVAATPPQAELDGNYDPTNSIGLMARSLSKGLRKLTDTVGKDRITLVFTNQLKTKIGVQYGDPMVTPGGKAIPYHASVRIRLSQSTRLKDEEGDVTAIRTLAKCQKTRLGPPLRSCYFEIHFDHGIDDMGSWFESLHTADMITKKGGWCYMTDVPVSVQNGENDDGDPLFTIEVQKEFKFREKQWSDTLRGDQAIYDHVQNLIEKALVVKYGVKPKDQSIDPESLMDAESVQAILEEEDS